MAIVCFLTIFSIPSLPLVVAFLVTSSVSDCLIKTSSMEGVKGGEASCSSSSNKFPAGLRILVVDDDRTCLKIIEKMLTKCRYEVTACQDGSNALSTLREGKSRYDVVLTDVHMPDMDGFKLLEFIGLEMDLPVVMMSADCDVNVARKGLEHGACYYLMKPVSIDEIKNIWQHTIRKKKDGKEIEKTQEDNAEKKEMEKTRSAQQGNAEDVEFASSVNDLKKRKEAMEEEEDDSEEHEVSRKKPRVNWDPILHNQFLHAVNQIGIDRAVPKKILELMNVPSLTRENVASHLQKYRLFLRKLNDANASHGRGIFSTTPLKSRHGFISPHLMSDYQNQTISQKLSEPSNLMGFQAEVMGNTHNFNAINPLQFPSQDLQNNPSLAGLWFGQSMSNTTGNMQRVPPLISSSKLGSAQSFLQQRDGNRGVGMQRMGSSSFIDGFNMQNDHNKDEFSFSKLGNGTGIPFSRLNQFPTLNHSGLQSMNPVGPLGEAASNCSMSGSVQTEGKDILPQLYSVDLSFVDHGLHTLTNITGQDTNFTNHDQLAGSFSNVVQEQNILGMENTSKIEGGNLSDIFKSSGV